MQTYSRRRLVQLAGAAGAMTVLEPTEAQIFINYRVRKNANGMASNDPVLQAYAAAIGVMKGLSSSDHRNWTNQASIHNNHCPHGNWFFLPWHRAYLYYFEQIVRDLSGDSTFNLPYWNWTTHTSIPDPFYSGNLNDPTRHLAQGASVDPGNSFVDQGTINTVMGYHDFQQFGSYASTAQRGGTGGGQALLESTPHNHVHSTILGNMGGYMSPLDPIFWMHHCNIDRIWAMWNVSNANTTDPVWANYTNASNFYDKTQASKDFIVKNVGSTYQLGYRYDTQPSRILIAYPWKFKLIALANYPIVVGPGPHEFLLSQKLEANTAVRSRLATAFRTTKVTKGGTANASVILTLHDVTPPADPGTYIRIFINRPEPPTPDTPTSDPYYAGSVSFFTDPHMRDMLPTFNIDITKTLSKLSKGGAAVPAQIEPQLVTITPKGAKPSRVALSAKAFNVSVLEPQ